MKKNVKKSKAINKVISWVGVLAFSLGFFTSDYTSKHNINLINKSKAYAISASGKEAVDLACTFENMTNAEIQATGRYLCDSYWCTSFCSMILHELGVESPISYQSGPDIRVEEICKYYMDEGRFHLSDFAESYDFYTAYNGYYVSSESLEATRDHYTPEIGDLCLFQWNESMPDHIGIYIGQEGDSIITIEGNPGDAEWWETRVSILPHYAYSSTIYGFIHPHYSEETSEERIEREAREKEEADIQSIADFAANMTGNTFEAMNNILDDNKLTVTFDPGDEGSIEQPTATVFRNACTIHSFPAAIANAGYTFVSWVDENGVPKDNNSIYENDTTLYTKRGILDTGILTSV